MSLISIDKERLLVVLKNTELMLMEGRLADAQRQLQNLVAILESTKPR